MQERAAGIERHWHRDEQADELKETPRHGIHAIECAGIKCQREHHHLHHAEAGNRQPSQQRGTLATRQTAGVGIAKHMRAKSDGINGPQDSGEPDDCRVETNRDSGRGWVRRGRANARQLPQAFFH